MWNRRRPMYIITILFFLLLFLNYYFAVYVKDSLHYNIFIASLSNDQSFSIDDINNLQQRNYYFTYESKINTQASSNVENMNVSLIGTNENFADITRKNLIYGSYFNQLHYEKLSNVIVIDSNVSWKLFGTTNSIGSLVTINNNNYEVIGVIENKALDKNSYNVYIPFMVLESLVDSSEIYINDIWIYADNNASLNLILSSLDYNLDVIQALDLELYSNIIMQRVLIIIMIGIGYIIYCLYKRCLKSIKSIYLNINEFLRDNYLDQLRLLVTNKYVISELLILIVNIIIILLLINTNIFNLYLPDNIFSIERLDFVAITSILNFFLLQDMTNSNLIYLNNINMISNIIFFTNVALTFIVFPYLRMITIEHKNKLINILQI